VKIIDIINDSAKFDTQSTTKTFADLNSLLLCMRSYVKNQIIQRVSFIAVHSTAPVNWMSRQVQASWATGML